MASGAVREAAPQIVTARAPRKPRKRKETLTAAECAALVDFGLSIPPLVVPFRVPRSVREGAKKTLNEIWTADKEELKETGEQLHTLLEKLPDPVKRATSKLADVVPIVTAAASLYALTAMRIEATREAVAAYRQAAQPEPPFQPPVSPAPYSRLT